MIPSGRKFTILMLTTLVVAAAGWAFYDWVQTHDANVATIAPLASPIQSASDLYASRPIVSSDQIQSPKVSSQPKPNMPAPIDHNGSIADNNQSRPVVDKHIADIVRETIRNDFPELDLAESDLVDLSETIVQLRDALANLRHTNRDVEDVTHIRQLEDIRDDALWNFERITGMRLDEFLYRLSTNGGIDNEKIDNDEVLLEPLSDYQP